MSRIRRPKTLGVEVARRRLPELLDGAHRGEVTLITKRGRPYAALVPPDGVARSHSGSLLSLRGTGKGLWGDVTGHVERLRREWS